MKYKILTSWMLLIALSLLGAGSSLAYFTNQVKEDQLATFNSSIVKIQAEKATNRSASYEKWVDSRHLEWTIRNHGTEDINVRTKIVARGSSPREDIILTSSKEWIKGKDAYYYYVNPLEPDGTVVFPLEVLFNTWESIQDYGINIEAEAIQVSNNAIDHVWPNKH